MMSCGYGHGLEMMFGPLLRLIVPGLVVAGVIWMGRRFEGSPTVRTASGVLGKLDLRFTRGELDAGDYAARKKLLAS